jgi:hypothetical protein
VALFPQLLADLPEDAQHLRPIESLTQTMFAKAHVGVLPPYILTFLHPYILTS